MMLSALSHDVKTVWNSLLPKDASFECHDDDEDILKLSLLLKSTHVLFTGLRQKQLSAASQLKTITDQLRSVTEKKQRCDAETKKLETELELLKSKLQKAEVRAKEFQKDALSAASKNERLQLRISAEVENRLHSIFNNCIKQNKATTVLDMMTQMYQESQATEAGAHQTEHHILPIRAPVDRVAHIKTAARNRIVSSPEVIPATPSPPERKQALRRKKGKCESSGSSEHKPACVDLPSNPSSPDVIADTPPSKPFQKKDNQKRHEKFSKLFNCDAQERDSDSEIENQTVVYAKETQDVDESPLVLARRVLRENIIVPETFNPDACEMNKNEVQSGKENENEKVSPAPDVNHSQRADGLPTDVKHPSTPRKGSQQRDTSPILGNSSSKMKNSSRSSSTPSLSSSISKSKVSQTKKKSQDKNSSLLNEGETSYRQTSSGKLKKSVQPNIKSAMAYVASSKTKRLSLTKKSADISKRPEFNGGQRSSAELSINISHLSEKEQVNLAIAQSIQEDCLNPFEDSDATLYVPANSPPLSKPKADPETNVTNLESEVNQNISEKGLETPEKSLPIYFDPKYASTAVEEHPPMKRKSPTNSEVHRNLGKPLVSSTEKDLTENSALHELTQYLAENDSEDDTIYPPETSYDRLPKTTTSPAYAYKGPAVRKKKDRKNLPGVECTQCQQYFEMAFDANDPKGKKIVLDGCSRHRDKNGPRVRSPKGYWDVDFPPTQVMRQRQQDPSS